MTRIAIVEDEEKYYHILKEYIQKYAGENSEEKSYGFKTE